MAFHFLSQLNQNAGYEVEEEERSSPLDEEEDRSSPVDEEEGENEESDIELDPEDARARANANLDLDLNSDSRLRRVPALNQTMNLLLSSELHDVEIEMFAQYTGPLFLLNMSDSMQTKYNTQKSAKK